MSTDVGEEWMRLRRPMPPVSEPRIVAVPRHPVVWISLGLVAASALGNLVLIS